MPPTSTPTQPLTLGLLVFPRLMQLDMTGPHEVFNQFPDSRVVTVWKDTAPLQSSAGLTLVPDAAFADCPPLDVICVPGGAGTTALMEDADTLAFLRRQAEGARYVTSVCTGSLVLGAAGLLRGRRAACYWMARDHLTAFGAIPDPARVVIDGSVITGGGVTAGIDFALTLAAELFGAATARRIQLALEYAPAPPFNAGSPDTASAEDVAAVQAAADARARDRAEAVARAASRLSA
ncbi:DJ-1/PfpI family protein [Roseospira marina]|uniref:DJ-1/PfpI family protein n=1 Tax=Roseospira marina TaxID=140057 RepID=A0A5M6IEG3_9PROT|nr:DJ-1/PfpI family protein [Roseospira marina]KAA5606169.1 DJ-1/PfpI family protein [Roseospira marina]MBB4314310.1 cyclohexyl-isocyanide hydratase [Roseospira marina]MBB5087470.1 cyclohexyl-isocyanide hydratase [Roseospira marina]